MSYDSVILADSPVSYWNLTDASGTTAADGADTNPGTYNGGFTLNQTGTGSIPGGTLFNGSTGYVGVPHAANLAPTAAVSVECWLKLAATISSPAILVRKSSVANSSPFSDYGINVVPTSVYVFEASVTIGSTNHAIDGTTTPVSGQWYHVALTYDGATLRLYVNGVQENSSSFSGSVATAGQPLSIGANRDGGSTTQAVNGTLFGVAVYNVALSPGQVLNHYYAGGIAGRPITTYRTIPQRLTVQTALGMGLIRAMVPGADQSVVGVRDVASGAIRSYQGSAMTRARGSYGSEVQNTHTGSSGVILGRPIPNGATQFTFASYCTCDAYNDLSHLYGGENVSTANMRFIMSGTVGLVLFQIGVDGAFTNLTFSTMPLNQYVLLTARLTSAGTRSIWMNGAKVAERTDAGAAYGSGVESNGSGWGGSPQNSGRHWSGRLVTGYVWNRAISDSEITALAADPFAPVRPQKTVQPAILPPVLYRIPLLRSSRMNDGYRELVGGFVNG